MVPHVLTILCVGGTESVLLNNENNICAGLRVLFPAPGRSERARSPLAPRAGHTAAHCDSRSLWLARLRHFPAHRTFSSWPQGELAVRGLASIAAPGMCPPQLSSEWFFRAPLWGLPACVGSPASAYTGHCLGTSSSVP